MTTSTVIVLAVIVILIVWAIGVCNSLVSMRQRVNQAYADIDVQLRQRHDLVPNLVIGLFFLVYVLVYAGALVAAALSFDADLNTLLQIAWIDLIKAAPFATIGATVWIVIAYYFHQSMIDAVTGGREIERSDDPRLYTILENLCISRGIPTPKLKVMESDALNAFATGMNAKQYSITVTTGLLDRLDDAEIESVLGHELTISATATCA
jgi:heat shock protein HtpX